MVHLNENTDKYHLLYFLDEVLLNTPQLKLKLTPFIQQWPFHLPHLGITSPKHNLLQVATTPATVSIQSAKLSITSAQHISIQVATTSAKL